MKDSHVLIVDDNKQNIQVLAKTLEKANYRISIAQSGQEALTLVKKRVPDLILLDIMMPQMDGYETLRTLQEIPGLEGVPVIFLTAKAEKEEVARGLSCGAVDYITKPFYEPELLLRVATHLEIKHGRDTIAAISKERKSLIHILCHDLLNPVGQVQMIVDLDDDVPGTLIQMKKQLKSASTNAVEIIEMVRHMTSIEEMKYVPEIESHSLEDLITEGLQILETRLKQKEIQVHLDIPPGIQVAVEKVSFINTVFNNIITNAVKFSYHGAPVHIRALKQGDEVLCEIADQGIGMSEKLMKEVFDIKKSSSRPGTEKEKGTGYGMPLVKRFVESYGGSLTLSSVEEGADAQNHGTTLSLCLKSGMS